MRKLLIITMVIAAVALSGIYGFAFGRATSFINMREALDQVQSYEVTEGRDIDTVYQNTSRYPLLVTVSVAFSSSGDAGYAHIGSTSSPSQVVAYFGGTSVGDFTTIPVTFLVPANYYYKISSVAGVITLGAWSESLVKNEEAR